MRARGIGEQQFHRMHFRDRAHRAGDHAIGLGFRVRHLERLDELVAERAAARFGAQAREHALHGVREQIDHSRERAHLVGAVRVAAVVHVARRERLRDVADGHGSTRGSNAR